MVDQELAKEPGAVELPYARIPSGENTINTAVKSNGLPVASQSLSYTNMAPLPGACLQLGRDPPVPAAPWTPLEVEEDTVSVWGRAIVFGDGGLPGRITSAGLAALAAPIRLRA